MGDDPYCSISATCDKDTNKKPCVYIHDFVQVMTRSCLLRMEFMNHKAKNVNTSARQIDIKKIDLLEWSSWDYIQKISISARQVHMGKINLLE
jgi:hypothetical protein